MSFFSIIVIFSFSPTCKGWFFQEFSKTKNYANLPFLRGVCIFKIFYDFFEVVMKYAKTG